MWNLKFESHPHLNPTQQYNESNNDSSSGSYGYIHHEQSGISGQFMYHINDIPTKLLNDIVAQYNKDDYFFIDAVLCKMKDKGIPFACILFHGKYETDNKILHQLVSKSNVYLCLSC